MQLSFQGNGLAGTDWARTDIDWERETLGLAEAVSCGKTDDACGIARRAAGIARDGFAAGDPRLAAALANLAIFSGGKNAQKNDELLLEARGIWAGAARWIDVMRISLPARSSIFHMRMERRHRLAYEENQRRAFRQLANEASERLSGMFEPFAWDRQVAKAACLRWQTECPPSFNDSRKLLAAIHLLLPGVTRRQELC